MNLQSIGKLITSFNPNEEHRYGPNWIYFARNQFSFYQNDTEPKLYPDAYMKMVPQEMADQVVNSEKEALVEALDAARKEIAELRRNLRCAFTEVKDIAAFIENNQIENDGDWWVKSTAPFNSLENLRETIHDRINDSIDRMGN